jgi:hypothetical protein
LKLSENVKGDVEPNLKAQCTSRLSKKHTYNISGMPKGIQSKL